MKEEIIKAGEQLAEVLTRIGWLLITDPDNDKVKVFVRDCLVLIHNFIADKIDPVAEGASDERSRQTPSQ